MNEIKNRQFIVRQTRFYIDALLEDCKNSLDIDIKDESQVMSILYIAIEEMTNKRLEIYNNF